MSPPRRAIVLAALAICTSAPTAAGAQATTPAIRVTAPAPRQAAPAEVKVPMRDTAQSSKPLSQRVFDTPWVLFPTRLATAVVLLAVAVLFLMSGSWGAVRFAHLLRHLKWKEPPRRLKRGELGAAGASLAFEFEEQSNVRRDEDAERDRQIAWLRTSVLRLMAAQDQIFVTQNQLAGALGEVRGSKERGQTHGAADDLG